MYTVILESYFQEQNLSKNSGNAILKIDETIADNKNKLSFHLP